MSEEPKDISFDEEFDINIQRKFLGLLVLDKTWAELNGLKIIKPEYFEDTIIYNICKWIHDYYKEYKDIPTKLILKEKAKDYINKKGDNLQKYFLYTDALEEIFAIDGGNASLQYYQDKAIAFVRQQTWKQAIAKAGKVFTLHNYENAMEMFKQIMSIGSENDLGLEMNKLTTEEFLSLAGDTYDKCNMIKTGIPSWDAALGGGFVRDNLHIIAACFPGFVKVKTNKGKITFKELSELDSYEGLKIYSYDGKEKIENNIKDVFKTKEVTELISLKLNNGKTIKCTPEHLFVIKNPKKDDINIFWENNIAYKQAKDLTEEDIL